METVFVKIVMPFVIGMMALCYILIVFGAPLDSAGVSLICHFDQYNGQGLEACQ